MAAVNARRFWLGALAGGVVWGIWSTLVNTVILGAKYVDAMNVGQLLKQSRYIPFPVYWYVTLFLLSYILTWIYVSLREMLGPGPLTALRVGFLVGFATAFPVNLSVASWAPFGRVFPLWWMIDLWVGAILATLVSGWIYRE